MKIETMLSDEIKKEIGELGKIPLGSEEYRTTVDGVTKLMDRAIEIEKTEAEFKEKVKNQEIDNNLKVKQMQDENKDRIVRNILTAAGIVIPAVLTIWGTSRTLKFEETGTITTFAGRNFVNNLFRKK